MKKFLTLLFIIISQFAFSQFEYIELPNHNKERYDIAHIYEDGLILATTRYPFGIYVSQDNGSSWEEIKLDNVEGNAIYYSRFHMNYNNQHFISFENFIYEIKVENLKLTQFFSYEDEYENIDDYGFLPNGNLLVAESRSFRLYSSSLNLIKEHEWWTHSANILIGENGKNYVTNSLGASDQFLEFNDNLSYISSGIPFYSDYYGLFYSNNRIFLGSGFSDDGGLTYERYAVNDSISIQKVFVKDERVILHTPSGPFLSNDYGNSFELLPITLSDGVNELFLHSESGITITSYNVFGSKLRSSSDNGNTHIEYDLLLGKEYSRLTATDYNGNIIVFNDNNTQRFDPVTSAWNIIPSNFCSPYGNIISQANGSFISNESISYDGGKNWDCSYYSGFNAIFDKNEILYQLDDYYPSKSNDFGLSWELIYPELQEEFFLYHLTTTSDGSLISLDNGFYSTGVKYFFKDGGSTTIDLPGGLQDVVSSYSSSEVYYKVNVASQIELYRSINGYSDLEKITLPAGLPTSFNENFNIKVDFLNNVYLYTDDKIYTSNDTGTSWEDISPNHDDLIKINSISLGRDLHLYISTIGTSVLKSIEPLGRLKELEVVVFQDLNMNCEYDEDEESLIEGFEVALNGSIRKITNSSSSLSFKTISLENDLNVVINNDLYNVCDYDQSVIFNNDIDEVIRYIPITIEKECSELKLNGSTTILRRCFDNKYFIEVTNVGSVEAVNVEVDVLLDQYFEFISCTASVISQLGQQLKLNLGNIPRNSSRRFRIDFLLSCDAELGEAHYLNASLEMEDPCYDETLSTAFECRENIGSFDPNDKQALINGISNVNILPEDSSLEYLVRFQNTGTDTAFTVRIEDRLASAFDLSSLEIVSASHNYSYEIDRRNLIVTFNDILLPDSTTNELESNGFVKFKVDVKEDYKKGYNFKNNADIFFDFNDPVKTNTTLNYYICKNQYTNIYDTICPGEDSYGYTETGSYYGDLESHLGCDSSWYLYLTVRDELAIECQPNSVENQFDNLEVVAFPNPTKGNLYLSSPNHRLKSAKLISSAGQLINEYNLKNYQIFIESAPGIYFLDITTFEGRRTVKKIIVVD
jgi:hypothetical protein